MLSSALTPLLPVFGEIFTVTLPGDKVSQTGQDELNAFLRNVNHRPLKGKQRFESFPDDFEWASVTKKGTIGKRVVTAFFETTGVSLSRPDALAVSNMLSEHTLKGTTYQFRLDNAIADWKEGEYGDAGSCMYHGSSEMRSILQNVGGFGVQFLGDKNEGIGRCWALPLSRYVWAIFNSYGMLYSHVDDSDRLDIPSNTNVRSRQDAKLVRVAQVFSYHFGVYYRRGEFTINGSAADPVFINNGAAQYLGDHAAVRLIDAYNYKAPIVLIICPTCSSRLGSEDEILENVPLNVPDLRTLCCVNCRPKLYTNCVYCSKEIYRYRTKVRGFSDTLLNRPGRSEFSSLSVCSEECLDAIGYKYCTRCLTWQPKAAFLMGEWGESCNNCDRPIVTCTKCGKVLGRGRISADGEVAPMRPDIAPRYLHVLSVGYYSRYHLILCKECFAKESVK